MKNRALLVVALLACLSLSLSGCFTAPEVAPEFFAPEDPTLGDNSGAESTAGSVDGQTATATDPAGDDSDASGPETHGDKPDSTTTDPTTDTASASTDAVESEDDVDASPPDPECGPEEVHCNGIDDDCDPLTLDDACPQPEQPNQYAACSGNICKTHNCDEGTQSQDGLGTGEAPCEVSCSEATDIKCDGVDQDCDGVTDEGDLCANQGADTMSVCDGDQGCKVQSCESNRWDLDGLGSTGCEYECAPAGDGTSDATCDGVDDDCDGEADEDHEAEEVTCGVGVCAQVVTKACVEGQLAPCEDGDMSTTDKVEDDSLCDGLDNDCDGETDEDFVQSAVTCGLGACIANGTESCFEGAPVISCQPGTGAADDATCDGVDDDCDGEIDEDHEAEEVTCGVGVCAQVVTKACVEGQLAPCEDGDTSPVTPADDDSACDGLDNDCDGGTDEDYVAVAIPCGTGACTQTYTPQCTDGVETECPEISPQTGDDATCDAVDNDCDGDTDEDFVGEPESCGTGACMQNFTPQCVDGTPTVCVEIEALSEDDSSCDGVDNDCDGDTDEEASCEQHCMEGAGGIDALTICREFRSQSFAELDDVTTDVEADSDLLGGLCAGAELTPGRCPLTLGSTSEESDTTMVQASGCVVEVNGEYLWFYNQSATHTSGYNVLADGGVESYCLDKSQGTTRQCPKAEICEEDEESDCLEVCPTDLDGKICTQITCVDEPTGEELTACLSRNNHDVCTAGVACETGVCDAGNQDADAATGCVYTPDDTRCDDGEDCAVETCEPEVDAADAITGCVTTIDPESEGTECSDRDLCTLNDLCEAGQCLGTPKDCSEFDLGVMCKEPKCFEGTCVTNNVAHETPCEHEDDCVTASHCEGNSCVATDTVECWTECSAAGECPPAGQDECEVDVDCYSGYPCIIGSCVANPTVCDYEWSDAGACSFETSVCCEEKVTAGCPELQAVEHCVCEAHPECCTDAWGDDCVEEAEGHCGLSCIAGPGGYCGDGDCDPGETAGTCLADCSGQPDHDCCTSILNSETSEWNPGCVDEGIETCVCALDSWCCEFNWDRKCAITATNFCGLACTEIGCGNGTCEDYDCGSSPCDYDEPGKCPADCDTTTPFCGDGACDPGEDATWCPEDCSALCGDEICAEEPSAGANEPRTCPWDCPDVVPCNYDYTCDPGTEHQTYCPDCPEDLPLPGPHWATCADPVCNQHWDAYYGCPEQCEGLPYLPPCTHDSECEQGNACKEYRCTLTADELDFECREQDLLPGSPCDDEDVCTTNDSCSAGECGGQPVQTPYCSQPTCDELSFGELVDGPALSSLDISIGFSDTQPNRGFVFSLQGRGLKTYDFETSLDETPLPSAIDEVSFGGYGANVPYSAVDMDLHTMGGVLTTYLVEPDFGMTHLYVDSGIDVIAEHASPGAYLVAVRTKDRTIAVANSAGIELLAQGDTGSSGLPFETLNQFAPISDEVPMSTMAWAHSGLYALHPEAGVFFVQLIEEGSFIPLNGGDPGKGDKDQGDEDLALVPLKLEGIDHLGEVTYIDMAIEIDDLFLLVRSSDGFFHIIRGKLGSGEVLEIVVDRAIETQGNILQITVTCGFLGYVSNHELGVFAPQMFESGLEPSVMTLPYAVSSVATMETPCSESPFGEAWFALGGDMGGAALVGATLGTDGASVDLALAGSRCRVGPAVDLALTTHSTGSDETNLAYINDSAGTWKLDGPDDEGVGWDQLRIVDLDQSPPILAGKCTVKGTITDLTVSAKDYIYLAVASPNEADPHTLVVLPPGATECDCASCSQTIDLHPGLSPRAVTSQHDTLLIGGAGTHLLQTWNIETGNVPKFGTAFSEGSLGAITAIDHIVVRSQWVFLVGPGEVNGNTRVLKVGLSDVKAGVIMNPESIEIPPSSQQEDLMEVIHAVGVASDGTLYALQGPSDLATVASPFNLIHIDGSDGELIIESVPVNHYNSDAVTPRGLTIVNDVVLIVDPGYGLLALQHESGLALPVLEVLDMIPSQESPYAVAAKGGSLYLAAGDSLIQSVDIQCAE
jgi:hypothetical protein